MDKEFAIVRDGINVDFLGIIDELCNDHGVFGGDSSSSGKHVFEGGLFPDNVHGSTGEHVGRPKEDRVPDTVGKLLCGVKAGDLCPFGLVNANGIEDGGELVAVFSVVDLIWIGTEDVKARLLEPQRDVLRELAYQQ